MSDIGFTDSQSSAVAHRGSSVIVSAGAGSGKTKVLTERLIRMVADEGQSIDRFVVITFTKAAAAELKGRISKELRKKGLKRQEALLSRAQIGTIHHFCSSILRENAHQMNINPDFRILSEERYDDMKAAIIERVIEKRYDDMAAYPGFEELVNTVGVGRNDDRLIELVLSLHEKMQCHSSPRQWAADCVAALKEDYSDISDTMWGREILSYASSKCDFLSRETDALLLAMEDVPEIMNAYGESISVIGDNLRTISKLAEKGWGAVAAFTPESERLKPLRNSPDEDLSKRVKDKRKKCKDEIEKILAMFSESSAELIDQIRSTAPTMEALLSLTLDFDDAYSLDKRRLNVLDYNDLEHMTAEFLRSNDISQRYEEIMVDEYQDVNEVQDEIFRKISRDGKNLFVVGDIKQSIYRFRLADPGIFKAKLSPESAFEKIYLRENFRSEKKIIDAVNGVFENIMTDDLGDTDYRENKLVFGKQDCAGDGDEPEILLVRASDDEDRVLTEARYVAGRILEIVSSGKYGFGDIAVLMRSPGKNGDIFRREFTARNIPVSFGNSGGFFDMTEVSSLISILKVLDNPHNDIHLIAALRSPFFGFTPDELSGMRKYDTESDFYTAMKKSAPFDEKCAEFLEELKKLRHLAPDMTEENLIRLILNDTDAEAICSMMDDGAQRMANLMQMIAIAAKYEGEGYHGLHRFIMYIERLREKGADISAGTVSGNSVRIMSVHLSKGLQFPVVFLCDTAHQFNFSDAADTVLVHPELGLGPKVVDVKRKITYPTVARNAIALRIRKETRSEEMRLMYVALTRASERLYITACVKEPEELIKKAPDAIIENALCPLTWFLYAGTMKTEIVSLTEDGITGQAAAAGEEHADADAELLEDFDFKYEYAQAVTLPSLIVATELKRFEAENTDAEMLVKKRVSKKPYLTEGKPISAAERGTATHICLEHINFNADVDAEVVRLLNEGFITKRQASAVDTEAIKTLLGSELGSRMKAAEHLYREFGFSIICDAYELMNRAPGEEIMLRGVVDCCIEEDDGIVIIDYKTDRVSSDAETAEKVRYYKPQLMAYEKALARVFGKPVKETVVYFLDNGQGIKV